MNEKKKLERNIKLEYIISGLMWMRFFVPVLALFYIASQVPFEQFTIIMAVFSLTIVLLQIPTGTVADLLGKKKTLLISRFMYIIEIFLIAFFNGFWVFLIAKIISGIGVSLSSGTDSALLYDTLKKLKREKEHKKISGSIFTVTNVVMAFVFITGSFLFTINSKLPAIVSLPLIIIGFFMTFLLYEPYKSRKKLTIPNSIKHINQGIKYVWKEKYLRYLALHTLMVTSTIAMMFNISSSYFEKIGLPIFLIGTVAFISNMLVAFASKNTHKLEGKLGERKSLFLVQAGVVISVLLMSIMARYIGILFYLLIPLISGFSFILINDYANRHAKTSHRSTMLSINNMFGDLGTLLMFPLIGYATKNYSMGISLLSLGIFAAIYLSALYLYSKKLNIFKNKK